MSNGADFVPRRLTTDQTHFYIMATSLINVAKENAVLPPEIYNKLIKFDAIMEGKDEGIDNGVLEGVKNYVAISARQTTDVPRRKDREKLFTEILKRL